MEDSPSLVLITVIMIGIIIFILAGIMVFTLFFYQRRNHLYREQLSQSIHTNELLTTRVEMHEQTLHQISQELHDNIGQLLSTTNMFLTVAEQSLGDTLPPFTTAKQTLSQALKELRALSKSLNSEWLNKFDLLENLKHEVDRMNSGNRMRVTLQAPAGPVPLPADAQLTVFRVIQEAVQNSIKHAGASSIAIAVCLEEATLKVQVRDNGIGFKIDENTKEGVGTLNMRHRIELLCGTIHWASAPGQGTEVNVAVPIE